MFHLSRGRFAIPLVAALLALAFIAVAACGGGDSREVASIGESVAAPPGFEVTTPAFAEGGRIPARYTCDGEDASLPISWSGAPAETASFAVILDDPDAPGGTFKHWIIFDIPPSKSELAESIAKSERVVGSAVQLKNDFGKRGYGGPCPPRGQQHRYQLFLYALDGLLQLPATASQTALLDAIEEHALARAGVAGVYVR